MNSFTVTGIDLPASTRRVARQRTCPDCNDSVYRVQRRLIDRIISLVNPVRRYRCGSLGCLWEGNLRGNL